MMADDVLIVPMQFFRGPLWRDPVLARAYLDLQQRADLDGRIDDFSRRTAAAWWSVSYRQTGRILSVLEDANLVYYPEGQPINRAYPITLTDPWREGAGSANGSANGSAENRTTTRFPASFDGDADQQPDQQADQQTVAVAAVAQRISGPVENGSAGNDEGTPKTVDYTAEVDQQEDQGRISGEDFPSLSPTPPIPTLTLSSLDKSRSESDRPAPVDPEPKSSQEEAGKNVELFPDLAAEAKKVPNGTTNRLMRQIVELGLAGVSPTGRLYSKQAAVVKRLVVEYGEEGVLDAINGMAYVYPYSDGDPWDSFILERNFAKARAKYAQVEAARAKGDVDALPEDEREAMRAQKAEAAKKQREKREERERLELEAERSAWRLDIEARLRAEPKEVRKKWWEEAKRGFAGLPLRLTPDRAREFMTTMMLELYGRSIGRPAPGGR